MKNFQDLTISDYLQVIRRRIWYVLVTTALVGVASAYYVWRMPLLYKSETTIMVSSRLVPEDYIGTLVRDTAADRMDFVRQQLRTRSFVERIVQEFQLANGRQGNIDGLVGAVLANTEITFLSTNTF